jgi:hypothetical protein
MLKFVTTNVASNERKLLSELSDRMPYEHASTIPSSQFNARGSQHSCRHLPDTMYLPNPCLLNERQHLALLAYLAPTL